MTFPMKNNVTDVALLSLCVCGVCVTNESGEVYYGKGIYGDSSGLWTAEEEQLNGKSQ